MVVLGAGKPKLLFFKAFCPQRWAICPQRWALWRSTYFEPRSFFAPCALQHSCFTPGVWQNGDRELDFPLSCCCYAHGPLNWQRAAIFHKEMLGLTFFLGRWRRQSDWQNNCHGTQIYLVRRIFWIITTEWLEKFKFLRFAVRTWDLRSLLSAETKLTRGAPAVGRSTSWTTLVNVSDSGVPRLVRRAGPGRRRCDWWTARGGMWRSSKWRCGIMLQLAKTAPDDLRSRWRHGRRSKFVFLGR